MSVYFIQQGSDGPIKIGFCRRDQNVQQRLDTLRTANPYPLHLRAISLMAGQQTERELHRTFAHARLEGEWFQPTEDLLRLVEAIKKDPEAIYSESARLVPGTRVRRPGRPRAGKMVSAATTNKRVAKLGKRERERIFQEQLDAGMTVRKLTDTLKSDDPDADG